MLGDGDLLAGFHPIKIAAQLVLQLAYADGDGTPCCSLNPGAIVARLRRRSGRRRLTASSGPLRNREPRLRQQPGVGWLQCDVPHRSNQWDVMAWKATALDLVANRGIDVPAHELVQIDERSVLLLERFDRDGFDRIP